MSPSAEPRTVCIYALVDPRTGEVRYVGKTVDPVTRLRGHLSEARKGTAHRHRWLAQLIREGELPRLLILERVDEVDWPEAERRQIVLHRQARVRLTNGNDGGDGAHNPSAETRAKISANSHNRSPETRAKLSAAMKGKKFSPEARARLSVALTGRAMPPVSPETRAKLSAAAMGKVVSPETRAKLSAAATGNTLWLGRKHTPETRARLSVAAKKRAADSEWRARHSAAMQGRTTPPETRARQSLALKAFWAARREEAVLCQRSLS